MSQAGCRAEAGCVGLTLPRRLREVKWVVRSPTARKVTAGVTVEQLTSEVPLFPLSARPGLSVTQGPPLQAELAPALAQSPGTNCLLPVSGAKPVTPLSLGVLTCHMVTTQPVFLPSD